ncbi:site-specific DNA-methyltransferase [Stutzerimonas stutzeri]|uniref:site-specific DNA-methyltransferase n=1 Tax=Stutzerimonas stutzeri TaxID=316 RepID=UPI00177E1988|nr:site-specific DNA-methyltransferase [Stutzerimonas stutzeri]MBD9411564.1 site-specific DNA-methyltransferase [Stutzerimonas stutzeri]
MTELAQRLKATFLSLLPTDGATKGNGALRREIEEQLSKDGLSITEEQYWQVHAELIASRAVATGKGRGGSVRLVDAQPDSFGLATQVVEVEEPVAVTKNKPKAAPAKPSAGRAKSGEETQVISYRHQDKRKNNPEVGMVTPATDPDAGKTKWAYDPHLDPSLNFDPQRARIEQLIDDALESGDVEQMRQVLEELKRNQSPYLNWAGKPERTSFEVDTVSLHVHERIDPASILSTVRKMIKKEGKGKGAEKAFQPGLFDAPFENLPLRDAIDFYRHERGWANRLIAGDSLLVMNSLLQKESMAGRVQMIYFDPPYGIKYGSNFQPFVGKRDVKDRNDADLTQEPEMIKAFRDTWELGIHSYLTYLRDRLLLARELLHESGSVFVQISDENLHHVREICDEVFGSKNFVKVIAVQKTGGLSQSLLPGTTDYLVWYSKSIDRIKFYQLYDEKSSGGDSLYQQIQLPDGKTRRLSGSEKQKVESIPRDARVFRYTSMESANPRFEFGFQGKTYEQRWKTGYSGLERLTKSGRIYSTGQTLQYQRFLDDFPVVSLTNNWTDTGSGSFLEPQTYVVQTVTKIIERCLLMTSDPGDLVLDPTCGSGTTAVVAEKWGRRWITCDTSRVAITLAKQRLMTASYDYFELKYPHEGLKGGFIYKTVPHVTLKSIANNPDIDSIYERMYPAIEDTLSHLNALLKDVAEEFYIPWFTVTKGGRKGEKLDFQAGNRLLEWEVPYELPKEWLPESVRYLNKHAQPGQDREPTGVELAFEAFHKVRQAMQQQMDASIAAHADQEVLYDQPAVAKNKLRITGPFTVEAVPFPSVKSLDEASGPDEADASIARTGESGRQHQWLAELLKNGARGKDGQILKFSDLEPLPFDNEMRSLHACGHLSSGERVVVSFGPEHAALEQRQVANALNEASNLFPVPKMVVFCAFTFDPEAAKDIDSIKGITALKAQMDTDLLTEDLKKKQRGNQSFWLMGQPEVLVHQLKDGRYQVEIDGFDYFDIAKGELVSGSKKNIAMWSLDTDYDERSLFPHQVFFPMAAKGEGWERLKKNIRAELDESRLDKFHGTISLPFEAGDNRKIAVKIVDDRGIESLKVIALN